MPSKLTRFCKEHGCAELTINTYCEMHQQEHEVQQAQRNAERDKERGSSTARGYDYRWEQASRAFLRVHPVCIRCQKAGRITPATVVDHIVPHRGNKEIFWTRSNWQPLCKPCHDRKTAREDGAFGNEVKV